MGISVNYEGQRSFDDEHFKEEMPINVLWKDAELSLDLLYGKWDVSWYRWRRIISRFTCRKVGSSHSLVWKDGSSEGTV